MYVQEPEVTTMNGFKGPSGLGLKDKGNLFGQRGKG